MWGAVCGVRRGVWGAVCGAVCGVGCCVLCGVLCAVCGLGCCVRCEALCTVWGLCRVHHLPFHTLISTYITPHPNPTHTHAIYHIFSHAPHPTHTNPLTSSIISCLFDFAATARMCRVAATARSCTRSIMKLPSVSGQGAGWGGVGGSRGGVCVFVWAEDRAGEGCVCVGGEV